MDDTELDRVARLFPAVPRGKNPNPGYLQFLADALGVSYSTLSQWRRRRAGRIPVEYRPRILAAADAHGVSRAALAAAWGGDERCPCCGQIIPPGTVHA